MEESLQRQEVLFRRFSWVSHWHTRLHRGETQNHDTTTATGIHFSDNATRGSISRRCWQKYNSVRKYISWVCYRVHVRREKPERTYRAYQPNLLSIHSIKEEMKVVQLSIDLVYMYAWGQSHVIVRLPISPIRHYWAVSQRPSACSINIVLRNLYSTGSRLLGATFYRDSTSLPVTERFSPVSIKAFVQYNFIHVVADPYGPGCKTSMYFSSPITIF